MFRSKYFGIEQLLSKKLVVSVNVIRMTLINKSSSSLSLSDLLGGDLEIVNYYELVLLARRGISPAMVESVINYSGMSKKAFVEDILHMSIHTFQRKRPESRFNEQVSSLVIEVVKILELAYGVFGGKDNVQGWLSKSSKALHGNTPLQLFSTSTGLRMIDDVLTRIEEGVYS
jgi:putative toxin-antitoxin system antitoxin component (TIGR02293 family)